MILSVTSAAGNKTVSLTEDNKNHRHTMILVSFLHQSGCESVF